MAQARMLRFLCIDFGLNIRYRQTHLFYIIIITDAYTIKWAGGGAAAEENKRREKVERGEARQSRVNFIKFHVMKISFVTSPTRI